jgi:alpha-glucosidase
VQDIAAKLRQDPIWCRSGGADPGRDGSRVPLPWSGAQAPFGFSPPGASARPWLPQPEDWQELTVESEAGRADSMLELYRSGLAIRRSEPALGDGLMTWLDVADGVLALDRGTSVRCVVNISAQAARLPEHAGPLLSSGPLDGELLPPDCAVWLRTAAPLA